MSSQGADSMRRTTTAENRASGSQFLADGQGDQNVALGNGFQYNDHSHRSHITFLTMQSPRKSESRADDASSRPPGAAIIDWLISPLEGTLPDIRHRHVELLSQVTDGTGKWVLTTDEFQQWKDPTSSSGVLPLHGILGAGKSVLASLIIHSLKEELKSLPDVACIYFYSQDDDDALTPSGFWASLLKQLLTFEGQGCIATELTSMFSKKFQGSSTLHLTDYWDLFKAQTMLFKTVYLILDAPNGYLNHNRDTWQSVLNCLENRPSNLKLLFTSRDDELARRLGVKWELRVMPKRADVGTYVRYRIDKDTNLKSVLGIGQHRDNVVKKVTNLTLKSEMFLLARLHLDNLSKYVTLAAMEDALSHLPVDSTGVFEASAIHISTKYGAYEAELARHVLTWVTHAKAGLTVNQVRDSFAIQQPQKGEGYRKSRPSKNSVISVCAGLIIKDSDARTLRLVHESSLEFLRRHNLLLPDADLAMAKTCLTYLLIEETGDDRQSPLFSYAASHWISHFDKIRKGADKKIKKLIMKLLMNSTKVTRAFNAMPAFSGCKLDSITGLHAAVHFNLDSYIDELIDARFDVNARCSDGQTALHWAVKLGRRPLVKCLIQKSAEINIGDSLGDTPLHLALKWPVTDTIGIVQDLVRGGADFNIPGPQRLSAISWAIQYGPTAVAEILLSSQKDVNAEITPGWTALRELFCHNHSNAQPPGIAANRWTLLELGVEDHVRSLIHFVLDQDVDLNVPTSDGWLPLKHALMTGSVSKLRALVTRDRFPADVNMRLPNENWSPLRWALSYQRTALVKLLVEFGADVNEKADDGWTPLIQAVKHKNEDIVWLLLKTGASPETMDNEKRLPLLHAIQCGNRNIVWLLMTGKATILPHSNMLLNEAFEKKDHSIAWLLCEHGADPNASNGGMTLLHKAVHSRNLKDLNFLLDHDADVSHLDRQGCSPLHLAVLEGFDEIVEELASRAYRKGHLDIWDGKGNTALILATLGRKDSIVEILLHHQASCDIPGSEGKTALHHAAGLGLNNVLSQMIRRTRNINLFDTQGNSAVHHAVMQKHANAQTINILQAGGADLSAKATRRALTPVMVARDLGKHSFVRQIQALESRKRR